MLIDSHCHLDRLADDASPDSLKPVVERARAAGVKEMLCVSVSQAGYEPMRRAAEPFDEVVFSCGVHPLDIKEGFDVAWLRQHAQDPRVVAIGETGLDYYYSKDNILDQQRAFAEHLEVARELDKPVIVHTRDAREDTLGVLREGGEINGVLHCFTENWAMAKAALDMGLYISISGIITFRNAEMLRDVVRQVPLDRLLVETDSPYLAPVPYRGKQNQPAYVKEVAQYVADLKHCSFEALCRQTGDNYQRLFRR
ncbi:YchF/TatD family DNA exonuclease [Ferrimonas sediminicola]|uniref:YchF/TatD family DNA exonuclease n=1 Tax=Ferrimonas sediminicola TaxID=2569538 RepID=A0A4U1BI10_9GAMM|nr:YchF/TatD family DNA exonuclease [Ferrimonas sediminicola]TKB50406.1 YchF/TatD family DNA exonuclease [Ferrimonas sediminicola]